MKYHFESLKQILDIFKANNLFWATEISNLLWLSRTIVHKYLKELVEQGKLEKVWSWPKTKYKSLEKTIFDDTQNYQCSVWDSYMPDYKETKLLNEIFYKFSADWEILIGIEWMKQWCEFRDYNLREKVKSYIKIYKHIESIQNNCWLLDATSVFWTHFEKVYLDNAYYADQYKYMEFWRWKLAEMTFYAKQSQNKNLIKQSIGEIILKLECIIRKNWYDAIAITPWSIDRKNQLLQFLKNELKPINLPFINIIKYYPNAIPIPQKSLKTRQQRIKNAKNTIFVDDGEASNYKKVFLIDDFVWSGSTLNQTALKLKNEWIKQVDWFAFVWNINLEYDVINEV